MSAQNTLLIKYYNLLIKCYNPNYKVQGYKVECCNKVQFLNDIPQLHIRSQESFLSASCLRKFIPLDKSIYYRFASTCTRKKCVISTPKKSINLSIKKKVYT